MRRPGAKEGRAGGAPGGAGTRLRGRATVVTMSAMSLLFLAIGLAAGLLSGLFGIGGGIIIVPALLLIGKMSPATATGTSLGSLLLPVGALGAWHYYKSGHLDVRASLLIALGIFLGAYVGAVLAQDLDPVIAKRAFAVFLVMVSVRIWVTA
jgi:uncharacterized membrane protein YfcA